MDRIFLTATLLVLSAMVGCSGSTETIEVNGVVTVDGKPMSNIEVKFHSTSPTAVVAATTNSNGRYRVDLVTRDGEKDSTHRVVLTDLNIYEYRDDESDSPEAPESRIHEKYAHLLTSNLTVSKADLQSEVDFTVEGNY